jgi:flagellar assembly factor FliW
MLINTKFLGDIEINKKDIITFQDGLPGFAELRSFVLLPVEGNPSLHYMQSIEESYICFIVINPFLILEDYQIDINEETVQKLDLEKAEDASLFSILTIPEDYKKMTANLMAPIVINNRNNKAIQEIQNDDKYPIKHKLFREE